MGDPKGILGIPNGRNMLTARFIWSVCSSMSDNRSQFGRYACLRPCTKLPREKTGIDLALQEVGVGKDIQEISNIRFDPEYMEVEQSHLESVDGLGPRLGMRNNLGDEGVIEPRDLRSMP